MNVLLVVIGLVSTQEELLVFLVIIGLEDRILHFFDVFFKEKDCIVEFDAFFFCFSETLLDILSLFRQLWIVFIDILVLCLKITNLSHDRLVLWAALEVNHGYFHFLIVIDRIDEYLFGLGYLYSVEGVFHKCVGGGDY